MEALFFFFSQEIERDTIQNPKRKRRHHNPPYSPQTHRASINIRIKVGKKASPLHNQSHSRQCHLSTNKPQSLHCHNIVRNNQIHVCLLRSFFFSFLEDLTGSKSLTPVWKPKKLPRSLLNKAGFHLYILTCVSLLYRL